MDNIVGYNSNLFALVKITIRLLNVNQDPTYMKVAAHHAATFLPRQPTTHSMPYRDPSNQAIVKDTTDHGKPSIHAEMSTINDSLRPSQIMQSNHIKRDLTIGKQPHKESIYSNQLCSKGNSYIVDMQSIL
jgi:hypothetical protein